MTFPKTPRVIFRRNPLAEVVCQLRFPPILAISSQAPAAFQEKIRDEYPFYSREEELAVPPQLASLFQRLGASGSDTSITHKFLTDEEESDRFISLTTEFVAITARRYTRWEQFRSDIQRAQAALEEVYKPSSYSRIGLRYVDIIDLEKLALGPVTWGELINPALLGVLGPPDLRDRVKSTSALTQVVLDDVPGATVRLKYGLAEMEEKPVYVVDSDFFTTERREGTDVLEILDRFNRSAGDLFRWAITDRLREALDPVALE